MNHKQKKAKEVHARRRVLGAGKKNRPTKWKHGFNNAKSANHALGKRGGAFVKTNGVRSA